MSSISRSIIVQSNMRLCINQKHILVVTIFIYIYNIYIYVTTEIYKFALFLFPPLEEHNLSPWDFHFPLTRTFLPLINLICLILVPQTHNLLF